MESMLCISWKAKALQTQVSTMVNMHLTQGSLQARDSCKCSAAECIKIACFQQVRRQDSLASLVVAVMQCCAE